MKNADDVGDHDTSDTRPIVPCPEVVVAGFGITFFAGEMGPIARRCVDLKHAAQSIVEVDLAS